MGGGFSPHEPHLEKATGVQVAFRNVTTMRKLAVLYGAG
jgi:hypothetical protein